jgi:beta-glucosidase
MDASKSPDRRAHELLAAMSLDDKITIVHQAQPIWQHYGAAGYIPGNPALCIPDLVLNDAGQGVGDQEVHTTAFPSGIAQSASWDPALQRRLGRAIGNEAWHKGINVQLAPDVNIARVPMNGRNSEAFGEDPYLAGQTGAAEIAGIQDNPVMATVKHYALNNHEVNRMTVSSDADERTVHEIYLPAFETAVKQAKTGSVMCSYNRVNGVYACENPTLLNGILKRELGFDGFVMSDWGGTHSTVSAANGGLDMEMDLAPGRYFGDALKTAVQSGKVPQARLDDMVVRILRPMFRIGLFEHPAAAQPAAFASNVETPEDVALAREVSEEGTVLLKNDGAILPLAGSGKRIALIGDAAGPHGAGLSYNTGGSARVPEAEPKDDVVSPLQGIQQRATADGDVVVYADGASTADAVAAASAADVAIVFANDAQSEGSDRPDLSLSSARACTLAGCAPLPTNQDALIEAVAQANPRTVVVLDTGGPMLMPWLGGVKGLLQAWYPGQEDGNAIAALLFGDVSPSAKLPQTFPKAMADLPTKTAQQYPGVADTGGVPHARYSEGLRVGYRWYDTQGIEPLFPFGFGLSYTTFDVRGLTVKAARGGAIGATVGFDVANTGRRAGAEVGQVYVGLPASTGEPPKRLAGYRKLELDPGASGRVSIALDQRAFSYWDAGRHEWRVAPGCYRVMAGRSSADLPLKGVIAAGAHCAGALASIPAAAKGCVDTRRFSFRLHHAPHARVVRVAVYVNGHLKLRRHGRDIRRVTLARLPQGRFRVRIVSTQSSGSRLVSRRTYHGCLKGRPTTRAHHHRGRRG